jgi:hypothetical protein
MTGAPLRESSFPAWDAAFSWSEFTADWVPVTRGWGWHKDIELKLCLLLDAGIPACLHDRPFGELQGWLFGQVVPTAILVPPESLEDARALLDAPLEDAGGVFEAAGESLQELRGEPGYRRVRVFLRAYATFFFASYFIGYPALMGLVVIALAVVLL